MQGFGLCRISPSLQGTKRNRSDPGLGDICVRTMPIPMEAPMKRILLLATVVLSACSTATPPSGRAQTTLPAQTASSTQNGSRGQTPSAPPDQVAPAAGPASGDVRLNELDGMTFSCAKAGLNAAARAAAKAPANGRYQFSYFRVVSSSHHSIYEVHFKSNNYEDSDLKYCVTVYCQQGWDPSAGSPAVSLMGKAARTTKADDARAGVVDECSGHVPQKQMKHSRKR